MTNVEIVKAIYAAYAAAELAEIQSYMADDVAWLAEGHPELIWMGQFHGRENTTAFFAGLATTYSDPVLEMDAWVAEGHSVAVFGRYQATVRANGVRFDTPLAHYWRIRDGKVVEYRNYTNSAQLLEASRAKGAAAA